MKKEPIISTGVAETMVDIMEHQTAQNKLKCKSHPMCSHNTNGRDLDKPCSIEFKGATPPQTN